MKLNTYELKKENGDWLGIVILSDDGSYFSLTDWGNFSFHWSIKGEIEFEDFIIRINPDYFAEKMYIGINYLADGIKIEEKCNRYANKILPVLQKVIIDQRTKK